MFALIMCEGLVPGRVVSRVCYVYVCIAIDEAKMCGHCCHCDPCHSERCEKRQSGIYCMSYAYDETPCRILLPHGTLATG